MPEEKDNQEISEQVTFNKHFMVFSWTIQSFRSGKAVMNSGDAMVDHLQRLSYGDE